MAELVRTDDPGLISMIQGLLSGADVPHQVIDRNMSILEGTSSAIQIRNGASYRRQRSLRAWKRAGRAIASSRPEEKAGINRRCRTGHCPVQSGVGRVGTFRHVLRGGPATSTRAGSGSR
jgi:hypothetical protein